jgi:hypothetical protein
MPARRRTVGRPGGRGSRRDRRSPRFGGEAERVGLFCTLDGSGDATALAKLQQDLHPTPPATLALTDRQIDSGTIDYRLTALPTL